MQQLQQFIKEHGGGVHRYVSYLGVGVSRVVLPNVTRGWGCWKLNKIVLRNLWTASAVNLKGIWPRRAPAVHAAGGLGAFYLFIYLFIFKFS